MINKKAFAKIIISEDVYNRLIEDYEKKTRLFYLFDIVKHQLNIEDLTSNEGYDKIWKGLTNIDYVGYLLTEENDIRKKLEYAIADLLIDKVEFLSPSQQQAINQCKVANGNNSLKCVKIFGDIIKDNLDTIIIEKFSLVDIISDELNLSYEASFKLLSRVFNFYMDKRYSLVAFNKLDGMTGISISDVDYASKIFNKSDDSIVTYLSQLIGLQNLDMNRLFALVKSSIGL